MTTTADIADTTEITDSVDLFATESGRKTAVLPTAIFQQLIDTVSDAAASKSHIPALMTVRLTAEDGALTARATDLSWGVEASVPATVIGSFDVCLAAKRLSSLAASYLPTMSTKLDLKGTEMVVTCDRSVSRFKTVDPEEFPQFPKTGADILSCAGERIGLAGRLVPWAASTVTGDRLNAVKLTVTAPGGWHPGGVRQVRGHRLGRAGHGGAGRPGDGVQELHRPAAAAQSPGRPGQDHRAGTQGAGPPGRHRGRSEPRPPGRAVPPGGDDRHHRRPLPGGGRKSPRCPSCWTTTSSRARRWTPAPRWW